MIFSVNSVEETTSLGIALGKLLKSGDIVCLTGDLGTGKTHITKGIAKGLEITDYITSPTFTIVQVYEGEKPLYHFDMYRIEDPDELEMIGYEDYFYGQGICLVEWANNVPDVIPREAIWIDIQKDLEKGFDYRKITIR